MEDCKDIEMPLDPKTKLKKNVNKDDEMVKVPLSTSGGILDICHVVYSARCGIPNKRGESTHGKSKPRTLGCSQAHFRYLQSTLEFKLRFGGLLSQDLVRYCDVDWAIDLEDRKSTIGFVFMMGCGAISCSSKRQPIITLSTTEAEYMANMQATKETIWMTKLMKELGYIKEKKAMVI